MENQLLFSMRWCSLILLFLALSSKADESSSNLYSAIYYGDSDVNVGEPFSITCIVSISNPIRWLKDGENLSKHNLRHGKDDHAFIETEHGIEGEGDKIEATLSVRRAISIHEGKYQCNSLHSNYHYLRVHKNEKYTTVSQNEYDNSSYISKPNKETHFEYDTLFTDLESEISSPLVVTTESYTKNKKRILDFKENEYLLENKNNKNIDFHHINKPNTNKNMNVGGIKEEIENESDEEIYRHLSTANPQNIKHSKITHKSTELSTITSNFVTSIVTHSTNKPNRKAAEIKGDYDNEKHMLKSFEIRYPLVLSCNVTSPGVTELKWKKNGTYVDEVATLKGRHKIIDAERKFIIEKTDANDAGPYSCVSESTKEEAQFNVYASVAVRVPSNTGVVEGEKLIIHCLVVGTEPSISWTIGNKTIVETTDHYVLKEDDNGIKNAIFSIENVSLEDRGDYKCTAKNLATEFGKATAASDTSFVRVKGKLAALWPFLGICAEVFILCAIILIYEKRRNKTELDESDTDPNTEQKKKRRNYD